LRALRSRTPSKLSPEEAEELAELESQAASNALKDFNARMADLVASEAPGLLFEPDYNEERRILDGLQVDLSAEVTDCYLDPTRGHQLLIRASGNRVAANAIFRQARRYADLTQSLVERLERLWSYHSPEEVEWKSKALSAPLLDEHRARASRARRHADYAEAAFWSLARTCEEIETLVKMYDIAARLGPPVGQPQGGS